MPTEEKHQPPRFLQSRLPPRERQSTMTIHLDASKEVLKRFLELNHKIHEEEVMAGFWEKKGGKGVKKLKDEVKGLFD